MFPMIDPERLQAAIVAIPGALLYGLYNLFALVATRSATLADYLKAALNLACAIAAGALMAYVFTNAITAWIPFTALRDKTAVAFVIGALGWELIPLAINWSKALVRSKTPGGSA